MNRRVRGMKERERSASAGTTALLFAVSGGDALICFLGDSPAFLLREGVLRRLTRPHNDAELLRKLKIPGRRPSLTRYLGIEESGSAVRPEFVRVPLCTGDRFLLCTDGLTNMVAEDKIREIMTAEAESGSCAGVLLKEALSAGGRDNITIVLCDVGS
jgi:protein phosphatase